MLRTDLLLLCLLPCAAHACQCQTSYSACNERGASDLVFTGTVESVNPLFLSRWNLAAKGALQSLNDAYAEAQDHPSDATLARLKDTYLKAFPEAADDIKAAKTITGVTSLFSTTLNRGIRVHFKVKTVYKHDDDEDAKETYDIETPFSDCGYDFQVGETYLVYANEDEGSAVYSTTRCTRTRRVSDAGEDLAYLAFHEDDDEDAARLEGFATTDERYALELSRMRDPETVKSPVPGLVIQLQTDDLTRYTDTDAKGHYLFDGLPEGDYKVSAYAAGYPFNSGPRLPVASRSFHLEPKACGLQILLLPHP